MRAPSVLEGLADKGRGGLRCSAVTWQRQDGLYMLLTYVILMSFIGTCVLVWDPLGELRGIGAVNGAVGVQAMQL
jgi:hypothetical protein